MLWTAAEAALVQALLPENGRAQTALEPVTVTRSDQSAFDAPAAVDVIDQATLGEAHPGISFAESAQDIPGLSARDRRNFAQDEQISIRGFGARAPFGITGVRIYIDGIPGNLPDGQGQISNLDLASVDRIEVLRGPFSALYGNSSGGVISAFTETGQGPPNLTWSTTGGSYGDWTTGLKLSGSAGRLGYVFDSSVFQTDGYRLHSAAERRWENGKFEFKVDASTTVTLVLNNLTQPRALDPLGLTSSEWHANPRGVDPAATLYNTRKTLDQTQAGLTLEHRVSPDTEVQVELYHGQRDIQQFQAIPVLTEHAPTSPGGVVVLGRTYQGLDLQARHETSLWTLPWQWVAGVSADDLDEARRGYNNYVGSELGVQGALRRDLRNTVSDLDPYLQTQLTFHPGLTGMVGVRESNVRFESVDQDVGAGAASGSSDLAYRQALPVAALDVAPDAAVRLYATAGRGFETPTLDQLAYRPDGGAGLNTALRPSTSDNLEVGAKWRPSAGTETSFSVFGTTTHDEIVVEANSGGRSTYQNAGETLRKGAEWSVASDLSQAWHLAAAYTYLDAYYRTAFMTCELVPCARPTVLVASGRRIPGVGAHNLFAQATVRSGSWRLGFEARAAAGIFANDINTARAPGYGLFNAFATYDTRIGGFPSALFLRLDNIADRSVIGSVIVDETSGRFYEPALGRSVAAGVSVSLR